MTAWNVSLMSLVTAQAWQVTALTLVVWFVTRRWTQRKPHLAHILWLLVLIKCLTPPLWHAPSSLFSWMQTVLTPAPAALRPTEADVHAVTAVAEQRPAGQVTPVLGAAPAVEAASRQTVDEETVGPRFAKAVRASFPSLRSLLLALWIVGTGTLLSIAGWRCARYLRTLRRTTIQHAADYDALVANLSRRLGLRGRVGLWITSGRWGPAVVGLFRPVIVLPEVVVRGKRPEDLTPLIAHELIHVRRGDLWLGLLQTTARALWWFHPLVWLAARLSAREVERCCDEEVVGALGCDPARYARILLEILELKRTLQLAPVFPGVRPVDVTSQRLERIMQLRQGCRPRTPWWCWATLVLCAAATLPGAARVTAEDKPRAADPAAKNRTTAYFGMEIRFISAAPQLIKQSISDWQIQAPEQDGEELGAERPGTHPTNPSPENMALARPRSGAKVTTETRLPVSLKILDDRQASQFLVSLEADARTNILLAPKVCVCNGQTATVQDESQRPFMVGVKDGKPQLRVFSEGIRVNLRPVQQGDKLRLDLELTGSEISRVSRSTFRPSEHAEELTFEIPEVRETKIQSSVDISAGQTILLNIPELRRGGKTPRPSLLAVRVVGFPSGGGETSGVPREGAEHCVYVHNVADLVGVVDAGVSGRREGGSADQAARSADLAELARRIRAAVEPRTWDDAGGAGRLQPFEASLCLIVRHTAQTQLTVHNYLNELRAQRELPINPNSPQSSGAPRDESALQTQSYAVADLVIPVANFTGSAAPQRVKPDFGALMDLVTSTVEPANWSCVGGRGTITAVPANLSLVIEQTASAHRQIAELLTQLRRLQDIQVSVETKLLGVPERLFDLIGRDFPGADGPTEDGRAFDQRGWIHLSAEVAARLSSACQGDQRAEILQSPKLTLFNAQGACIGVEDHGTEINLEYKIVVAADGKSVQLTVATRQGKAEARPRTYSARIPDGDALLLDATEELKAWAETQTRPEQADLFSRIFDVSRLFVEPPPRRTIDHVLLLVSPRVLIAEEEIRASPPLLQTP